MQTAHATLASLRAARARLANDSPEDVAVVTYDGQHITLTASDRIAWLDTAIARLASDMMQAA